MSVFMINRSLPDLMMGVETSIPQFTMDAAAPKGAPRRPQLPDFLETVLAPPCPERGPEAGNPHSCDFHGFGVNSISSWAFQQSRIFSRAKKRSYAGKGPSEFYHSMAVVFHRIPFQRRRPQTPVPADELPLEVLLPEAAAEAERPLADLIFPASSS